MILISSLLWPLKRSVEVIKDHRETLAACDSITGRAVSQWAKIMCLPQFTVAPLLGCLGYPASGLFFAARVTAMVVVGELDKRIQYTRALGLCHLVTFGPLFLYMLSEEQWGWNAPTTDAPLDLFNAGFVWFEMRITALCLYLDARDLMLHLLGRHYPCYIREAVQAKKLKVKDMDAFAPVTWWSRLVGP